MTKTDAKYGPEDIDEARKAALNARRLARMAKSDRDAVMDPKPLDYGEVLGLINAADYLAWCVTWMANELDNLSASREPTK